MINARFEWLDADGEPQHEERPYAGAPGSIVCGTTVTVRGEKRKVRSVVNDVGPNGHKVTAKLEDTKADTRRRCRFCGSKELEERGESGVFWMYCHACERDEA